MERIRQDAPSDRDLLDVTRREIEVFEPRDNIDIQSFIWIVGGYDEAEAGRAVTT
jgi:hypothetical protein